MQHVLPIRLATAAAAAALLVACGDSPTSSGAAVARGVVVLNGFGQQGVTLVADTGAATSRIDFGAQFDGGGMSLERDTVLSTSSRGGGDQLYVASLRAGTLTRVQLPAGSNPAGTAFLGGLGLGVALRDSGAVAIVTSTGAAPAVGLQRNVGRCPADLAAQGGAVWVLDANQNCDQRAYQSQGDSRLIRFVPSPTGAGARDTLVLAGVRNATSMAVLGNTAFVASGGVADFSRFPTTVFAQPGSITQVDLAGRRVVRTVSLPTGSYGAGLRVGADGLLYVTAYTNTNFSTQDVFAFDQSLAIARAGGAGKQSLTLTLANGAAPVCAAATADARGRVYCASNGAGSAATVYEFDAAGRLARAVPAGQGAVDIVVR